MTGRQSQYITGGQTVVGGQTIVGGGQTVYQTGYPVGGEYRTVETTNYQYVPAGYQGQTTYVTGGSGVGGQGYTTTTQGGYVTGGSGVRAGSTVQNLGY